MTKERFEELRDLLLRRGLLTQSEVLELMAALIEARPELRSS